MSLPSLSQILDNGYLDLGGTVPKTEAGWAEVMKRPDGFNRLWNHGLGLPKSDQPPPEPGRSMNPETGEIKP